MSVGLVSVVVSVLLGVPTRTSLPCQRNTTVCWTTWSATHHQLTTWTHRERHWHIRTHGWAVVRGQLKT
jgi:hypothetical protein